MKDKTDMNDRESMGGVIRRLRMEREWTQEELGELVGVSAQAVSKWETEQSLPDISQVPMLARTFGVTTDALFGLEEEPAPEFPEADALCTDPEEAWQRWRKMGRKLEEGPVNDACVSRWLFQGYLLCYPDSPVYHPERAKEARDELLSFAEKKYGKKGTPKEHISDFSLKSLLTNLHALAGGEEKALALIKGAPELPQELSWSRRAEVFRLLGKRKEEREQLSSLFALLPSFLLSALFRRAENALALGRKDEALYCVSFGRSFARLLFGAEKVDPLYWQDGKSFLQMGARVLLAQGKREEALAWLKQMVDEKLESLLPGYSMSVNTPLLRAVQLAPGSGNEKAFRYHRAMLLRALDHPDLAPLREEPDFRQLYARAEALGEDKQAAT
ncbi:MAG: helix-turn-helix domain-containing protein [Oscillospiraceae bacterium]|nr:helix-turn-helix domain-containing protein [Oscillospiraceae bacterium]